jgi:homopolymeric O-antigen transport system ATP-binding protein
VTWRWNFAAASVWESSDATAQTTGNFEITGQVFSLLELGTGFNAELTGRANVQQTARLLGLPPDYATEHMSEIEKFADLGDFFDRPVRIYSSGMSVRLAFSMFAAFEPEVLIVDEALAVGDASFQRKCYRRMEEMIESGQHSVIIAAHDTGAITKFCDKAIWLDAGQMRMSGNPQEVVQAYLKELLVSGSMSPEPASATTAGAAMSSSAAPAVRRPAAEVPSEGLLPRSRAAVVYPVPGAELLGVWIEDSAGRVTQTVQVDDAATICYAVRFTSAQDKAVFGTRLTNIRGDPLVGTNTQMQGVSVGHYNAGESEVVRWPLRPGLGVGDYFITCGCSVRDDPHHFLFREVDAYQFTVLGTPRCSGVCNLLDTPQLSSQA